MNRVITEEEVKKHADEKSIWMIIHHNVYDVTKFLDEHPGGADSLLEHAGQDSSQAFEDVGHSSDARELMEQYKIGTLPGEPPRETGKNTNPKCPNSGGSPLKWALIALAGAIIIGIAYKKYNS